MTKSALRCGRAFRCGVVLFDLCMTAGTIAVERLLIGERDHGRTRFMFDLGYGRHLLWSFAGACVTIATCSDSGSRSAFVEQIGCERGRTVRGPGRFQRRMLGQLGSRLCCVMAFHASDRPGTVDAVRAAVVLHVIESDLPELCVFSEDDDLGNGLSLCLNCRATDRVVEQIERACRQKKHCQSYE